MTLEEAIIDGLRELCVGICGVHLESETEQEDAKKMAIHIRKWIEYDKNQLKFDYND